VTGFIMDKQSPLLAVLTTKTSAPKTQLSSNKYPFVGSLNVSMLMKFGIPHSVFRT
jgi:hypothetical protein